MGNLVKSDMPAMDNLRDLAIYIASGSLSVYQLYNMPLKGQYALWRPHEVFPHYIADITDFSTDIEYWEYNIFSHLSHCRAINVGQACEIIFHDALELAITEDWSRTFMFESFCVVMTMGILHFSAITPLNMPLFTQRFNTHNMRRLLFGHSDFALALRQCYEFVIEYVINFVLTDLRKTAHNFRPKLICHQTEKLLIKWHSIHRNQRTGTFFLFIISQTKFFMCFFACWNSKQIFLRRRGEDCIVHSSASSTTQRVTCVLWSRIWTIISATLH